MSSIARMLRMTKGNLYYYFNGKEDLLFFCHDYSLDLILGVLDEIAASFTPPQQKLYRLIVASVNLIIKELHGTTLTLDIQPLSGQRLHHIIAKRSRFERGMRDIIKAGMEVGIFRKGDPKFVALAILGALNWIPRWFDPRGPAGPKKIAKAYADYLLAGLLTGETRRLAR